MNWRYDEDIWSLIMLCMQPVKFCWMGAPDSSVSEAICYIVGKIMKSIYTPNKQTEPLFDLQGRSYGHFSGRCSSCYWAVWE
jgi:hypothetical protein